MLADINRDGHLDLIGNGTGRFKEDHGLRLSVSSGFRVATLAELNGDRHLDLVSINGSELSLLLSPGNGKFACERFTIAAGMPSFAVVVANIDRDNNADLVVATVGHTDPTNRKSRHSWGMVAGSRQCQAHRSQSDQAPTTWLSETSTRMASWTSPHPALRASASPYLSVGKIVIE